MAGIAAQQEKIFIFKLTWGLLWLFERALEPAALSAALPKAWKCCVLPQDS